MNIAHRLHPENSFLRRLTHQTHSNPWFQCCPKAPYCPKHNPCDTRCVPATPPPPGTLCVHEKTYCNLEHSRDCCCHICAAIPRELRRCSEPPVHDVGCTCCTCKRAMNSSQILRRLNCKLACRTKESDACDLITMIKNLGERCFCLLCHAPDCTCKACVVCRADLAQDQKLDVLRKLREANMRTLLGTLATEHGERCTCIKCVALRQRVDMTLCIEHLETCRCRRQLGNASKCPECIECLRKKRRLNITKAEDYW